RHWFWDGGVIASNLVAISYCEGLPIQLFTGFIDSEVNRLICVEDRREAALVLASLGLRTRNNSNIKKSEVDAVHHETTDLASKEDLMYPQLWQMHEASYLTSKEEVQDWKAREIVRKKSELDVKILDRIQLLPEDYRNEPNLSKVILLRGSSRRFSRKSISFLQLCNILHSCTKGVPLDFTKYGKDSFTDIYLIANDVVGLPRGGY